MDSNRNITNKYCMLDNHQNNQSKVTEQIWVKDYKQTRITIIITKFNQL
jgi:hypothetical protein